MPLHTALTRALGIAHPIVQGGMHHVGFAQLAAAVSNAGGLGIITALTMPNPEALRSEIRKCRSLTKKPFGVNLTLLPALVPPNYDAYTSVVIEEGIKVVETAGRSPEAIISRLKKADIFVIHKCTSIKHALSAQKYGVDMISMDGFDCAGHPGEDDVGNWVLLPIAARKLSVPFLVSGGCGDGKQLAAALAMGACGMNMGTRFMATQEAPIHAGIKQALVDGDEKSTMLVMRSVRNTERVYKNKVAQEVAAIEAKQPGKFEAFHHLVRGDNYRKSFQETGDPTSSVWSCGQVMGLIDDVPTCQELIERIVKEAEEIITSKLPQIVGKSKL